MIIKNALVHTLEQGFVEKDVIIEDSHFADNTTDNTVIDGTGCYLIPGLVDVHFHGCAGFDFCDGTQEALNTIGAYELEHGITSICPASMTLSEEMLTGICKNAVEYRDKAEKGKGARICGINLEGPFISYNKKGAQNPEYIANADVDVFHRLADTADGLVKLITIAPETDGAMDFIKAVSSEVHISLGHTEADYNTATEAFNLGADHLTHLYNAMPPLSHRTPGPIGAAMDNGQVMAEIICDGIHIHGSAVRAAFAMLGADNMIFISDSMMATGMKDGKYSLGGLPVTVKEHLATLDDGTLAGSATNLYDCMTNAVKTMNIPLDTAVKCASYNPARSIGIDNEYGSIDTGKVADCLLVDKDTLELKTTIFHGKKLA